MTVYPECTSQKAWAPDKTASRLQFSLRATVSSVGVINSAHQLLILQKKKHQTACDRPSQLGDWRLLASDASAPCQLWSLTLIRLTTGPEPLGKLLIGGSSDCSNGRRGSRSALRRSSEHPLPAPAPPHPRHECLSKHKCHPCSDHGMAEEDKHWGFRLALGVERWILKEVKCFEPCCSSS